MVEGNGPMGPMRLQPSVHVEGRGAAALMWTLEHSTVHCFDKSGNPGNGRDDALFNICPEAAGFTASLIK